MEIQTIKPTEPAGSPHDIILRGKTKSPVALLVQLLVTLGVVWCIAVTALPQFNSSEPSSSSTPLLLLLGFVLYTVVVRLWKQWRFPPFIEMKGRQLTVQLAGTRVRTDATNISQIFMVGGHLCICLRDLQVMDPSDSPSTQKQLARQFQASGCHFVAARGVFDLQQMNSLRRALGQPIQDGDDRDQRLSEFEVGLSRATPRTWVTFTILVINILVFAAIFFADAMTNSLSMTHVFANVSPELILNWGGNFPPLTANGQQWRLLTCLFLHWTLIHLAFNMWILYDIGRLVERTFGSVPYLFAYLFSGICGSLATVYWSTFGRTVLSAGASGAVFGMFGLMLGMLWRRGRDFPAELLRTHKASCMGFVGFNLVFGMTMPNVDIAAHIGGLVGGLLCGLVARPILPPRAVPSLTARLSILAPMCVCVAAAGILLLPQPGLDFSWELNKFLAIEPKLNARYNAITSATDSDQTPSETAKILQRDVVGPWREERERMAAFKNVRPEDRAAWQIVLSYITAREESFDLLAQSIGEEDPLKQRQALQKLVVARAILENWVKKDGRRYGLSLPKLPTARD